jgi:hypothetical protein
MIHFGGNEESGTIRHKPRRAVYAPSSRDRNWCR